MAKESFRENPDDRFDTEMRLKALEQKEKSHQEKIDDETRVGVPSHDESMVSDWIRNRVEMPKDLLEGRKILKTESIKQPEGDYEIDLKKLEALSEEQIRIILKEMEKKSEEGRGLFSKGPLLNSYVIDPETLKSLQSKDHQLSILAEELADALIAADVDYPDNFDEKFIIIRRRIIPGTIYLKVPDLKTPIVRLFLGSEEMGDKVSDENLARVANYLKNERKLLPITGYCKVL